MASRFAHYMDVWAGLGLDRGTITLQTFLLRAVLGNRPVLNVITQYDVDPDSLVDESIAELRGFAACVPEFLAQPDMTDDVREAFTKLGDYYQHVADHPGARPALRDLWQQVIARLQAQP